MRDVFVSVKITCYSTNPKERKPLKILNFLLVGKYICTANNDVGTAKERILNLVVGFPPTIELPRPRVPQAAYYEAHLECHIRAYPSTTINWKRNETVLENDGNHFISHYADSDELVISTMKVRKLHKYIM